MTDCTHLSDRMPAVARGTAHWSAADLSHLEICPDCAAEWGIVRGAVGLGRRAEAGFDASRVAARVAGAMEAPVSRPSALRHLRWAVPLALAAGLFLYFGRPSGPDGLDHTEPEALTLLPEAEALSEAELELVIRLIPVADPVTPGDVVELTEEELTLMLEDLEG